MGVGSYNNATHRFKVPEKKTRLCVAGMSISSHAGRARRIAALIARKYPKDYETWFYFDTPGPFYHFTTTTFENVPFPDHLKGHDSSPFCWLETRDKSGDNIIEPLGGRSHFAEWAIRTFKNDSEIVDCASTTFSCADIFHGCYGDSATPPEIIN